MKKINWNTILLITLIIFLIWDKFINPGSDTTRSKDTLAFEIKINYDSAQKTIQNSYFKNYFPLELKQGDIPAVIDTEKIIHDYYSRHVETDIRRDSDLEATIIDTVGRNMILGRLFKYKILRPSAISNTALLSSEARNRLYGGLFAGMDMNKFNAGVSLNLIHDTRESYGIDYSITEKFPYNLRVRYLRLIRMRSPKIRPP